MLLRHKMVNGVFKLSRTIIFFFFKNTQIEMIRKYLATKCPMVKKRKKKIRIFSQKVSKKMFSYSLCIPRCFILFCSKSQKVRKTFFFQTILILKQFRMNSWKKLQFLTIFILKQFRMNSWKKLQFLKLQTFISRVLYENIGTYWMSIIVSLK